MKNLYQIALQTVSPIKLKKNGEAGHVGCALETVGGVVFTGICIDVPCSIGICAEQAAIAEMLKNRETKIKRIVAVYEDGSILPPCGRCRELMSQLDLYNENTMVVVDFEKEVRLKELLPERWDKGDAETDAGKINQEIVTAQFDFRDQIQLVLLEEVVQEFAGGAFTVEHHDRVIQEIFQVQFFIHQFFVVG